MNNFKTTFGILFSIFLISLSFTSCDNDSNQEIAGNSGLIQQKSATFNDIYAVAKDLGDTVTEDPSVDGSNALVFDSMQSYKDFVLQQKLALQAALDDIIEINCADGLYSGSIGAGMGTLTFDVVVSGGKISSVMSNLSGFTLGISYSQGAVSPGGSSATVVGFFNYNVFCEGIGTIYTQRVVFNISLNC